MTSTALALRHRSHVRTTAAVLAIAICILFGVAACTPSDPIAPLRAPGSNVVLITIDTLRADHIGAYGYSRDTTPNLDRFAEEAVRFEAAFSPRGLTFPAIASLLTSKHVYNHGVVSMRNVVMSESLLTMPEALKQLGYRTVEFNAHLGFGPKTGFHQGFDDFHLFHSDDEPKMVREAVEWLSTNGDERFFMWLHSFGPHSPYQAPEPWRHRFTDPKYAGEYDGTQKPLYDITMSKELSEEDREHIIALYDVKLAWIDDLIGKLLSGIDELGLRENTLVIVTADHGEELFDHHHFFSHESSAFDGVLRIPLMMRLPGRLEPGTVPSEVVVESVDVFPTVLDVLGETRPSGLQGSSLLPVLTGADDPSSVYAFGTVDHPDGELSVRSIRSSRWRYLENPDNYSPHHVWVAAEELYDLEADPRQQRNVVEGHGATAAELRGELVKWAEWVRKDATPTERKLDPKLEAQLEALGYKESDDPAE
jgi:arylsulfatase A-like enzyme